jgi:hypothetical protein
MNASPGKGLSIGAAKAAEDAVWHWVYSPTYLTGKPVEVEASIEVNFALN